MTDIVLPTKYRHVRGGFYLLVFFAAPFLLAPVYYQGSNPQMVEPAAGREARPGVRELPAAAPLVSPLLVTPSTVEGDTGQVSGGGEPKEDKELGKGKAAVPGKVTVVDARMCLRGLETLQDLAALAYQRTSGSGYMGVIVAGALVKQQLLDGEVPNIAVVKKRIHAIRGGKVLRTELQQGYVLTEAACTVVGGGQKKGD